MPAPKPPSLFRPEALEHQRARGLHAELLLLDTSATRWGSWLVCAALLALLTFAALGRLSEYATGPAFVQLDGRTTLTASSAGLITHVAVKPGDRVEKGDALIRFHAASELSELQAATREFDSQLAKLLLRPDDAMSREALVSLRSQRELAQERLDQRQLRAPHRGIVGDVRVREGQLVDPGLRMMDLQGAASEGTITALLPGRYRALLHAGDTLRFELDGFHQLTHELVVNRVGEQIVGPAEAARYVGRDLADAITIAGPVVLVSASLPKTWFALEGQRYDFASGMYGKAEAAVRNEPLAYAFVPGLKQWIERIKSGPAFARRWISGVSHVD